MARFTDSGEIAVSMDRLWAFLRRHLEDAELPRIHPDVRSQRTLSTEGPTTTVERQIRFGRRTVRSVWRISFEPPNRVRWEIVEGDGPMAPGSYLITTYSETPTGVRVVSEGEVTVVGFPRFLQGTIVRAAFRRIDAEDVSGLGIPP
jgi:hypothetical protein